MREFLSKAWKDPVGSKLISVSIIGVVLWLFRISSSVGKSVTNWIWTNIVSSLWGPYLLALATLIVVVFVFRRVLRQEAVANSSLGQEDIREIARQVAEREIVKYAQANNIRGGIDGLNERLLPIEFELARSKAEESLEGSYKEGALDPALQMIRIGRKLDHDPKISDGIAIIRRLFDLNASFDTDQIRYATTVLENLSPEFNPAEIIEG